MSPPVRGAAGGKHGVLLGRSPCIALKVRWLIPRLSYVSPLPPLRPTTTPQSARACLLLGCLCRPGNRTWVDTHNTDHSPLQYLPFLLCDGLPLGLSSLLLLAWLALTFVVIERAAQGYLAPSLEALSERLRLPADIAGATLLALGNGAAETFTQFAALLGAEAEPDVQLATAAAVGSTAYVATAVLGVVLMVAPPPAPRAGWALRRDAATLLVALAALLAVSWNGSVRFRETALLVALYPLYLIVVVYGKRWRARRGLPTSFGQASTQAQAHAHASDSDDDDGGDPARYNSRANGVEMVRLSPNPVFQLLDSEDPSSAEVLDAVGGIDEAVEVDTRRMLEQYSPSASPAERRQTSSGGERCGSAWRAQVDEFVTLVRRWAVEQGVLAVPSAQATTSFAPSLATRMRALVVPLEAPLRLAIALTMPRVQHGRYVDGDYLAIVVGGSLLMTLVSLDVITALSMRHAFVVALGCAGVSALGVALHACYIGHTGRRVKVHSTSTSVSVFAFIMGVLWIHAAADEIVALLEAVGKALGLSERLLGGTLLVWGEGVGDLAANVAVARAGNVRAALAACFAGPLVTLLVGLGGALTVAAAEEGTVDTAGLANGTLVQMGYTMAVLGALLVGPRLGWRRLTPALSKVLLGSYAAFTLLYVAVELDLVFAKPWLSSGEDVDGD